jgi:adhesin transport system membrane fusion protein
MADALASPPPGRPVDLPGVLRPGEATGPAPATGSFLHRQWQTRGPWLMWGGVAVLALIGLLYPVESVVVSPGRVIPSDRVKSVQHLEGGIVNAVLVKEGDRVRRGQTLVEIDLGGTGLNLEELTARHAALLATRSRLTAESLGRPLSRSVFPVGTDEAVIAAERGAYEARSLEQRGVMAGTTSAYEQARSRQLEQQTKVLGLQERLSLYEREMQISEQLLSEKLVGQIEVLEKRRQMESVRSDLAVARQGVVSAAAAITEASAKSAEAEGRYRRRASDELSALERQLASLNEDLSRARTQRSRTEVKAPSDGIVKGLRNSSSGWVVKPGEPIMEIVPDEEQILIEAKLSPNDRGFVTIGQPARVKISAYDFLRYGAVDGHVTLVAADADRDPSVPNSATYYRVLVSTTQAYVGRPENRITAGMEAEIDLKVGSDPFIWHMMRPVLKLQREAFREP